MTVEEVIRAKVKQVGIPVAELARRCGMNDELLRRSLEGRRNIKSIEFLKLCRELNLDFEEFDCCLCN